MIEPFKFVGTMEGGAIVPADPVSYPFGMAQFNGKPIDVTIKEFHKARTNPQGNAWHGIVIPIWMKCMGYHPWQHDEAHYDLCKIIHSEPIVDRKGNVNRVAKRTKTLNTVESMDLYATAQDFIESTYGIPVQDPDPEFKKRRAEAAVMMEGK